jgi:hypothetical protein
LGTDGIAAYEKFSKQQQEGSPVSDESEEHGQTEDVFGNPMMLSMLLCYLQTRQIKKEKKDKKNRFEKEWQ